MLFAQAEGFWKPPNVYGLIGLAGFVVGIGSVWYAWYLARKDFRKKIAEAEERASQAARDEVRRVARAVLQTGAADTARSLLLAREACRAKKWSRACELCEQAREDLARVLARPAADDTIRGELKDVEVVLRVCVKQLRGKGRGGETPEDVADGIDESIAGLYRVEGWMTGIAPEVSRE